MNNWPVIRELGMLCMLIQYFQNLRYLFPYHSDSTYFFRKVVIKTGVSKQITEQFEFCHWITD